MKTCGNASTNQSSSSTANACHSSIHPLHPIAYTTTLNFLPFENCHQSPNRKKITLNCDLLLFLKLQNFYFRRRYFKLFLARSQLLMRNYIKKGNHGGHGRGGGLPPGYWEEQGGRKAAAEAKKKRKEEAAAKRKADDDKSKAVWMAMVARSKEHKNESTTEEAEAAQRRSPRKHAASSSAASSAQDAESSAQSGA